MTARGFSILELLVAVALMLATAAAALALVTPGQAGFAAQLEMSDMQQRLRVASGALYQDLVMAGAGAHLGPRRGPLAYYFAPVLPYRRGSAHDDSPGTFVTDALTVMYAPPGAAQTMLSASSAAAASDVAVDWTPGCPVGDAACGFRRGMTALVYDASGDAELFMVRDVHANVLQLEYAGGGAPTYANDPAHPASIVQVTSIVYELKGDPSAAVHQLVSHEGAAAHEAPVVDNLVKLRFDYYGDPQPPQLLRSLDDPVGPWTTYGPAPPGLTDQIPGGGYPAGENCTFAVDLPSGVQTARLPLLDADAGGLVELTGAQLTDGPWCPDPTNPNRWDADLLRIRRIGVTLRIQSANAALRGPASALFTYGGSSTSGSRWLPDQEVTLQVTPRNLRVGN
jgi:type II secretory pathway pseudopilin PulG